MSAKPAITSDRIDALSRKLLGGKRVLSNTERRIVIALLGDWQRSRPAPPPPRALPVPDTEERHD